MKENRSKINTLIKRKNVIKLLKKNDINRISPRALDKIEKLITEYLISLSAALKEKIITKGKKTLEVEDISETLDKRNSEQYWEI